LNQASNIIAICYIATNGDERNKCSISNDHLFVKRKGKSYAFELEQITQIAFKQKRLLLPLIVGGVFGSLFLIAGFNFLLNIWIALILGLAGLLLFYYGWVGSAAISVQTKVKEYDIFINDVTPPLKAFVELLNQYYILGKSKNISYYLSLNYEEHQKAKATGFLNTIVSGMRIYNHPNELDHEIQFSIDPVKVSNSIRYELDEASGKVVPYIVGEIDLSELINIK